MVRSLVALVAGGVVSLVLAGCGGSDRPETIPVSGAVLYNGNPVEGATVSFWGPDASRAATGVTDAEGKFTLSMYSVNDGALAGENKVTVTKDPSNPTPTVSPEDMLNDPTALTGNYTATQQEGGGSEKPLVPAKYADPETSPLKANVADTEEGRNHILQLAD